MTPAIVVLEEIETPVTVANLRGDIPPPARDTMDNTVARMLTLGGILRHTGMVNSVGGLYSIARTILTMAPGMGPVDGTTVEIDEGLLRMTIVMTTTRSAVMTATRTAVTTTRVIAKMIGQMATVVAGTGVTGGTTRPSIL